MAWFLKATTLFFTVKLELEGAEMASPKEDCAYGNIKLVYFHVKIFRISVGHEATTMLLQSDIVPI